MGFYHHYQGGNIHIPLEQLSSVMEKVGDLCQKYEVGSEEGEARYDSLKAFWQENPWPIRDALSISEKRTVAALDALAHRDEWHAGFEPAPADALSYSERMQKSIVISFSFDEIKNYSQPDWLDDLAPFFQEGSYVQISNDDGDFHRLVVHHGKIVFVSPSWVIPE